METSLIDLETLILAGGKSSRMGQDKALLMVNNQPLLLNTYSIAQQVSNKVSVITSTVEKYQNLLPFNCNFIRESNPYQGVLMAFAEGLRYVESQWVFLLACDLPFLTVKEIEFWFTQLSTININKDGFSSEKEDYIAFLPQTEKGWDCLCGFYRADCLGSLNAYLKEGNRSFQKWLNRENIYPLAIQNKQVLFNCNTPEDYKNFRLNMINCELK